jgi:hypothetical protein
MALTISRSNCFGDVVSNAKPPCHAFSLEQWYFHETRVKFPQELISNRYDLATYYCPLEYVTFILRIKKSFKDFLTTKIDLILITV